MFGKAMQLVKSLLKRDRGPTFQVDDKPDPYRDFVLREVIRTGSIVVGTIESDGGLMLTYDDGTRLKVSKERIEWEARHR